MLYHAAAVLVLSVIPIVVKYSMDTDVSYLVRMKGLLVVGEMDDFFLPGFRHMCCLSGAVM
jgi:hypothetical protein